jgi:predicted transglutaminase-like cysteine proteinase
MLCSDNHLKILASAFIILGLSLPFSAAQASSEDAPEFLNGSHLQSVGAVEILPQWKRILEQYDASKQSYLDCESAPFTCSSEYVEQWQSFLSEIEYMEPLQKIENVNAWFNKLPYKQDNWVYDQSDYWASVPEFLEYSGDCEDFAIAKYLTLRQMGFEAENMWIALAYDIYSGTDHAFVIIQQDGESYVMDNRQNVIDAEKHSRRYRPHYLFNEQHVWVFDSPMMAKTIRQGSEEVLPGNR